MFFALFREKVNHGAFLQDRCHAWYVHGICIIDTVDVCWPSAADAMVELLECTLDSNDMHACAR